ncbi:MAG: hypothetical protein AAGB02_09620 [Pseudomonadota bacterium]
MWGERRGSSAIFLLISFAASAGNASASAWGRNSGDVLIITKSAYFSAPMERVDGRDDRFRRLDGETYIEVGVAPRVTVGGKVVYGASWTDTDGAASGFSEIQAFSQYRFIHTEKSAAAFRFAGVRPSQFTGGVRPSLQSDGFDVEGAVLYGRTLRSAKPKLFLATEAGFRKRLSDSADQVRSQITIGVEPNRRFLFLLDARAETSLRNAENLGADYDVVKINPSVVWRIKPRWRVQFGFEEEFAGRNLALGRTFSVGLWSEF